MTTVADIAPPEKVRCFCSAWLVARRDVGKPCHVCGGALRSYDEVAAKWGLK